jgi:hypothetical protein
MYIVGYFIKKEAKGDIFMACKLRGKTSVNCISINKKTEHIAAGTVCGNIYVVKINDNSLEVLKKLD